MTKKKEGRTEDMNEKEDKGREGKRSQIKKNIRRRKKCIAANKKLIKLWLFFVKRGEDLKMA